ncbi:Large ribosomal subunit protein [Trichinella spiralis]|uniref:Large ribosomal subunit protein n=1 Tax=Trichinella spiralis TaxID=6334 RepID=A0ABR3KYK3_TRISP
MNVLNLKMLLTSSILRFLSGKYHISVRSLYKKRFFRGIYLTDGMIARKGDVLVRMFNMDYFPGMNVSYKQEMHDKVLRAMCDGTVLISTENVEADFQYFESNRFLLVEEVIKYIQKNVCSVFNN